MRVAVASLFRDCAGRQVSLWARQVADLRDWMRHDEVLPIAVEGDSVDGTREQVEDESKWLGLGVRTVECLVRAPRFPSCESPIRLGALSKCLNAALGAAEETGADVTLFVESDLIWDAPTLAACARAVGDVKAVVAPLVFAGPLFYDVWGFRGLDGERFAWGRPYHREWDERADFMELSSVGSCLAIAKAAIGVRVSDGNALAGWCKEARSQGHRVFVATRLSVRHPV